MDNLNPPTSPPWPFQTSWRPLVQSFWPFSSCFLLSQSEPLGGSFESLSPQHSWFPCTPMHLGSAHPCIIPGVHLFCSCDWLGCWVMLEKDAQLYKFFPIILGSCSITFVHSNIYKTSFSWLLLLNPTTCSSIFSSKKKIFLSLKKQKTNLESFIYLFKFYLFMTALGLCCCVQAFSSYSEWGLL